MILAGQPSAIGGGLTHYWGGVGLQWTLRWRETDLNSGFRARWSRFCAFIPCRDDKGQRKCGKSL